jgi:hypothetical protein
MAKKDQQTTKTSIAEVEALLQRIREGNLADGDILLIERVVAIFLSLLAKIEQQRITVKQIRSFLFGKPKSNEAKEENGDGEQAQAESQVAEQAKRRRK